ncbi:pentapeptide repeat-containing protein, partial [Microcoleus sp. herbarium5]|uniref:pentapeptide repeat-containing protein n=1 Tax=Microcoleus sp. herbarium5 TaxID=3055434 RepID=UPI002FD0EBEF
MTVDEALTIAETALNYDRLNKIQEIVFRQSWEGQSYKEIAANTEYEYDYIKDAGAKLWKLLSTALEEKVKKDNLKSVLKRYLRRTQVNLQRNLTIEVNLSGANLSGANLSGARLFANLNEADYVQTDLDKTINADTETELSDSENEINWNGFRFHSDAQVKIAEILDRTSTL